MGVSVTDLSPDLIQAFNLPAGTKGALVQSVVPRGPAAKAGIEPGDLVVSINSKNVETASDLTRTVALVPPGENVSVTVLRKGDKKQLSFKVAQRPEDEGVASRGGEGESSDGEDGGPGAKADKSPKLGVSLAPLTPAIARELGVPSGSDGVVVTDVVDGGPAQRANVRRGDIILEVNRQPVKKPEDVAAAIGKMKEGQMALLRIKRNDQTAFIAVPVGGRQ
jgi:serine protease Do